MASALEKLQQTLRKLPGLGYRSAERIALHVLVEQPEKLAQLVAALQAAGESVRRCARCGNLAEQELCEVCADGSRHAEIVCVVERIPDLVAVERSGAFRGVYHVLHGKLSPLHGVGPEKLNLASLEARLRQGGLRELILALSNDIEGEATCHYITTKLPVEGVTVTRIGFGLPSGGGVFYADATTLRSALEGRRSWR